MFCFLGGGGGWERGSPERPRGQFDLPGAFIEDDAGRSG